MVTALERSKTSTKSEPRMPHWRVGLAYTFKALAAPLVKAKRLTRVLTKFSPTFPGFYLYYPSRHDQPTKLKALIEFVGRSAK